MRRWPRMFVAPSAGSATMSLDAAIPTATTASEMKVVERLADVRAAVAEARRAGRRIAFVPTMGSLHAGHLALVERARSGGACVVMSIFVNPLQFGPSEDFTRYPRDADGDSARARSAGTDLLFMPTTADMYPGETPVVVAPRVAADLW